MPGIFKVLSRFWFSFFGFCFKAEKAQGPTLRSPVQGIGPEGIRIRTERARSLVWGGAEVHTVEDGHRDMSGVK